MTTGSGSFAEFEDVLLDCGEARIRVRHGGSGPAVLLVHGHPRTAATWYRAAPLLAAAGFTVVCPDMRGYGASTAPPPREDHSQQSKRAVAEDLASVMEQLGHPRYAVVGHDRGCYVGLRLALDHPDRVSRLVAMHGIPISEALDRCDARFATAWYHWFFLAQPELPERAIAADPDAWYGGDPAAMGEPSYAEFHRAIHDPDTVRAMIEDYRAGLAVDQHHERADREAGRKVRCPLLFVTSTEDDLTDYYDDPVGIWRAWCDARVEHVSLRAGHHVAEENPEDLVAALAEFLAPGQQATGSFT